MATGTVVDVVMPQMGVSVSEGTVTRWLRNVGDAIEALNSNYRVDGQTALKIAIAPNGPVA